MADLGSFGVDRVVRSIRGDEAGKGNWGTIMKGLECHTGGLYPSSTGQSLMGFEQRTGIEASTF